MIYKLKKILCKNKEAVYYLFFGMLTVVINTLTFSILSSIFDSIILSNTIAFVIAVVFAYYTNAKYVFKSKFTVKNGVNFFLMRMGTLVIDNIGMVYIINYGINETIAKIFINIIVIFLNYLFSKLIIF